MSPEEIAQMGKTARFIDFVLSGLIALTMAIASLGAMPATPVAAGGAPYRPPQARANLQVLINGANRGPTVTLKPEAWTDFTFNFTNTGAASKVTDYYYVRGRMGYAGKGRSWFPDFQTGSNDAFKWFYSSCYLYDEAGHGQCYFEGLFELQRGTKLTLVGGRQTTESTYGAYWPLVNIEVRDAFSDRVVASYYADAVVGP